MNITKVHLLNLLNTGTNQYEIPFFQRPYVWKKEDCENLYEDILETLASNATNPNKEHFIGTIITKNSPNSNQMTAKFHLIDGQQRMTTFSVLLKALANSVDLNLPKAQFLVQNINNTLSFMDPSGEIHHRIIHNHIDRGYFEKIMGSDHETPFNEPDEQNKIIDTYRFFKGKFEKLSNEEILAINQVVLHKFPAISMVLDQHDDEQEIFDTINSLGVKLTTSELLKNYIFNDDQSRGLYDKYWKDVFESDEETIKFWNTKKTAGRVYRENIDVLLYCYLLIEREKDVSLEHLFKDYKEWLNGKTFEEKKAFLESLKTYAEIYANFPSGTELNDLKYSMVEERFFHVIENLNITTIYPLILFLYKKQNAVADRLKCLSLLESYLVRRTICQFTTKNYNNQFIAIVKSVKDSKAPTLYDALKETLDGFTDPTGRFPTDEEIAIGFANSIMSNQHAKEILFGVALFQIQTVLNDVTSLSSNSFSVEHMMPKKWQENWPLANPTPETENDRHYKLLTLGNLTIITKNLNSKLRNSSWSNKRSVLQQFSAIPLTTQYTNSDIWDENGIANRATDLVNLAKNIWAKN